MPRNPMSQIEERCKAVIEIRHGAAWAFSIAFMGLLWLLPLWEHVSQTTRGKWPGTPAGHLLAWRPSHEPIVDHLHNVERQLDRCGYAVAMRQTVQAWLTRHAGEGNRKTFIGYSDAGTGQPFLFYQPDLAALTGFGPLQPEPFSVMKDPDLAKLPEAKDVIIEFAAQLKERGVSLLLVPVPVKPMLYPEFVTGRGDTEPLAHPDAAAFYDHLRAHGIDVLDLAADFARLRDQRRHVYARAPDPKDKEAVARAEAEAKLPKDVFLRQDTHWTADGMSFAAETIAAHVRKNHPEALRPSFKGIRAVDGVERSSIGDLVKLLDLPDPQQFFDPEPQLLRVVGEGTEDRDSPITLLGDSFVNVYDDPTLGFEDPAKPDGRIHAGLAQHLSLQLQQPLDVIAMNGRGSTGVRQELAKRADDEVRAKKLVVWVIAARDLMLPRSAARDANIEWKNVTFNPSKSAGAAAQPPADGRVVVEAKLVEKSKNQDPNGSPYRDALHTALYEVENVVNGNLGAKQVLGVQWTFRDKQLQPPASFAPGRRYRLTLVPWESKSGLKSINRQEDVLAFDAPMYFVEDAAEL